MLNEFLVNENYVKLGICINVVWNSGSWDVHVHWFPDMMMCNELVSLGPWDLKSMHSSDYNVGYHPNVVFSFEDDLGE